MQWINDPSPGMEKQIVSLARELVAANPQNAGGWHALADTLRRGGALGEALNCLDTALARCPGDLKLLLCQTRVLYALDNFPLARLAIEQAMTISPSSAEARGLYCDILMRMGDREAATREIAALDTGTAAFFELHIRALLVQSRLDDAIRLCDAHLERHPANTTATFIKAKVMSQLGHYAEACETLTLDRFIEIGTLDPPASYDGDFRADVTREILRNPTLIPNPAAKAMRDGLHTIHLRQTDAPAVELLIGLTKSKIDSYIARLGNEDDPFVRARPDKARLSAWSIVYRATGHQAPHHHAAGWLSGVYFVRAPRTSTGDAFNGALLLGPLTAQGEMDPENPGTQKIEPIPGRIVLFPSYVPHATLVSGVENERIVVSFDVVPELPGALPAGDD